MQQVRKGFIDQRMAGGQAAAGLSVDDCEQWICTYSQRIMINAPMYRYTQSTSAALTKVSESSEASDEEARAHATQMCVCVSWWRYVDVSV